MPTSPRIPDNARGVVARSSFWATSERDGERWRRGWWDAFDGRPSAKGADEHYALGRKEYLEHFAPESAGRNEMTTTATKPVDYAKHKGSIDVLDLPLEHLAPNPLNTRKKFDQAALEELAASIKSLGLLQRVIARPKDGHFELIIGERRRRAALLAGLETIRAEVWHDVDDETAVEMILVENSQRADVAPIEEADGFLWLHEKRGLSYEEIAAKTGKSTRLVYYRVKLARNLAEPARQALADGSILQQTADMLALIEDPARQKEALDDALPEPQWDSASGEYVRGPGAAPRSFGDAKKRIERHLALPLAKAVFDLEDTTLVRNCGGGDGSCMTCPRRTMTQPALFEGVVDGDVCTFREGYDSKVAAYALRLAAAARKSGLKVLSKREERAAFPNELHYGSTSFGSEYAMAKEHADETDSRSPTWTTALLDKLPRPTHAVIDAASGTVVELYRRKDLRDVAKANGIELKAATTTSAASPRPAGRTAPPGNSRQEIEDRVERRVEALQAEQLVEIVKREVKKPGIWLKLVVATLRALGRYGNVAADVAARRGGARGGRMPHEALEVLAKKLKEPERAALLVELLHVNQVDYSGTDEPREFLIAFGVKTKEIEAAARLELDPIAKQIAADQKRLAEMEEQDRKKAGKKPASKGAKKPKPAKKRKANSWAGLTPAQRLARVNEIRKGKGLPAKAAL